MAPYGDDNLTCSKCGNSKPKSDFYRESRFARGYRYACKQCESPRHKNYINKPGKREKRNEVRRIWNRTKSYNFPPALYEERFTEQGNVCAICGTDAPGGRGQFHADHDHKLNQPRGILCHNCNVALGNFQDNVKILKAALDYLERWNNALRR